MIAGSGPDGYLVYLSSIRKIPDFSSDLKIGKHGLKALGDRRELGGPFYVPGDMGTKLGMGAVIWRPCPGARRRGRGALSLAEGPGQGIKGSRV